jgi:hypothetical protein
VEDGTLHLSIDRVWVEDGTLHLSLYHYRTLHLSQLQDNNDDDDDNAATSILHTICFCLDLLVYENCHLHHLSLHGGICCVSARLLHFEQANVGEGWRYTI